MFILSLIKNIEKNHKIPIDVLKLIINYYKQIYAYLYELKYNHLTPHDYHWVGFYHIMYNDRRIIKYETFYCPDCGEFGYGITRCDEEDVLDSMAWLETKCGYTAVCCCSVKYCLYKKDK